MSTLSFAESFSKASSFDVFGPPPPESGLRKLMKKLLKSASKILAAVAVLWTVNSHPATAGNAPDPVKTEQSDAYADLNFQNYLAINIRPSDVRNWLGPGSFNQMRGHEVVDSAIMANVTRMGGHLDKHDIKSDVFVRVMKCKDMLLGLADDEMVKLLHKLIANALIDARRRRKTAQEKTSNFATHSDTVGAFIVNSYEDIEARETLNRFSIKLTPREHEVFILSASGYKNKDIALRLNIKVETVRTHKSKYRKKFMDMAEPVVV